MVNETTFGEIGGREWLTYSHNGRDGAFAFPPVQGTHRDCYQAMKGDSEVVPAERLDLALLTQEAYTQETSRWQKVRQDCFVNRYVRAPMRALWIPQKNDLAGVLLERDLEGNGIITKMQMPENIDGWKKGDNGIYESPDNQLTFVPAESYKLGEQTGKSFAKDGFATAVLTAEGAEIFARTAIDAKKTPWTWGRGINIKDIKTPEQRVVGLYEIIGRLGVNGSYWGGSNGGCAFGVRKK